MRCLLLHPEDDPLSPEWPRGHWDRVIDLGVAAPQTYKKWREVLGCEIEPCPKLESSDFAGLRRMFQFGLGQMVDRRGLDWWDLISLRWLELFERALLLRRLLAGVSENDEVFVSSPGLRAVLTGGLVPCRVQLLRTGGNARKWLGNISNLKIRQMLEIAGDKYDGTYRYRRLLAPSPVRSGRPLVLLPSAYGNASRLALSYASALPELRFLLVATRQSGWISEHPANVKLAPLASYAIGRRHDRELQDLINSWKDLRVAFRNEPALNVLCQAGCFASLPMHLSEGLAIRDCWANLFEIEHIVSVLCADEKNPYTRIPILLAQARGIPTVACHHGALDGRYRYSDICADRFLAKGQMEWDYLANAGHISEGKVFVAAPPRASVPIPQRRRQQVIVFFSEPYELLNSRAQDVFGEVIPPLSRMAAEHDCELVVKLHPFESLRERKRIVRRRLRPSLRNLIRFACGPISTQLMQDAWFSATVSSTGAVDSVMHGVPAFLCRWLDRSGYGYSDQFVKFGIAQALDCAEAIREIPALLRCPRNINVADLWQTADPRALEKLLSSKHTDLPSQIRVACSERLWG